MGVHIQQFRILKGQQKISTLTLKMVEKGKNINAPHNNLSLTNEKSKRVVENDGKLTRNE